MEEFPMSKMANPSTFLLVHGAFTGGWCWRDCRALLTAVGHNVFTPTLTGLGERHHLASADVLIETHIADIANVIEAEELQGVVLVGHSSSGVLAAAVADRMPERIAHLVFLDSSLPRADGFTLQMPPGFRERLIDNLLCPPPPLAMQGVPDDHPAAAWYNRRRTLMPVGAAEGSVNLLGKWLEVPATFIACTAGPPNPHATAARAAAEGFGMKIIELPATHAAMATAPEALATMLQSIG
jgi:pimeloyl-ACP methyl ester carboxylesterase